MIEFKGRVLISGEGFGQAIVSKKVVSQVNAFGKRAENRSRKLLFSDVSQSEIYKKNLTNKVFIAPSFKQSNVDSMVLLSVFKKKIEPKCFLFAHELDPTTISAFILAKQYLDSEIAVIDKLGDEFLQTVENGDNISYSGEYIVVDL